MRENLEFVARLYGLAEPARRARAMIERLGLAGREEQLAGELSGGWKQRLALGACTLPSPQLLLLDEPTAGVDPKARREFWNEIHALAARRAHGAGLHPLHGRGRALPRDRLHRLWRAAGARHRRGGDRRLASRHLHGERAQRRGTGQARRGARAGARASTWCAPFGTSLHVSGRDEAALEAAIAPYRERDRTCAWTRSQPSLEDVFIDLMGKAQGQLPMSVRLPRACRAGAVAVRRASGAAPGRC